MIDTAEVLFYYKGMYLFRGVNDFDVYDCCLLKGKDKMRKYTELSKWIVSDTEPEYFEGDQGLQEGPGGYRNHYFNSLADAKAYIDLYALHSTQDEDERKMREMDDEFGFKSVCCSMVNDYGLCVACSEPQK